MQFLSKKYPKLAPFTTFQDVFYKVLPSKELYFNVFFHPHLEIQTIEEVTDEELFIAYAYTAGYWRLGAREKGGHLWGHRGLPRDGERVLTTPLGRKVLERRLGIDANTKGLDWDIALTGFRPLIPFSSVMRETDHHYIKSLFEKYGETEALLRISVKDPSLLDRILYAFTSDKPFKRWIYNPVETSQTVKATSLPSKKPPNKNRK